MRIINLIKNPEYLNQAITLEIKNYGESFVNSNPAISSFLIEDDKNRIVGGVDYQIVIDMADILFIYIDKEYRGNGLSHILLKETLKEIQDIGVKKVYLEVRESNTIAIKLYNKNNFYKIGIRKAYYENKEDAILMRKDL